MAVQVRSNGFSAKVQYREGLTVAQVLQEVGVRKRWGHKLHVSNQVVEPDHVVADGDTVTVAPRIKNG